MTTVIVGGGIAGLTAAWHLVSAGVDGTDVVVLEGSPRVGGKLALAEIAGQRIDVGAESMLAVRPEATDLIREVGLGESLTVPATTSAAVWSRGRLWPLPTGTLMGVPADPEAARGLLTDAEIDRLVDERPWPEPLAGDVSVGDYLAHRLGDAVVDRLVEPLLSGVYAAQARSLSMAASVPPLFAAAQRGGSILAAAAAAGAARAGTRPGASAFCGIVGGVGRLPERLREALTERGVMVRTGVTVRELTRVGDRWQVTTGAVPAPAYLQAEQIILAVPPPAAGRLLRGVAPDAADVLAGIEMASMAIITLALDRRALERVGRTLPGSGFLVPATDGRTIKASTFSSNKWGWAADADPELFFLRASIGRAGAVADLQRPDAELVEIAVAEVGEAVGFPLHPVVDSHVQRWGGGLPQYAVGHLERIARVETAIAGVPGLEVCGAAYGGVGIPAVIASARAAASRLLTTKGHR
ncbi:MAG TPA: protoporphyrinogen oxidase [Intrasporangiaceae bacterium]|nr:protoporphyrinogen oxidase [Intrasporangiaceae bacterium]